MSCTDSPQSNGTMKKFTSLSLSHYLEELSSTKPVPGGGSVSAYVASLAIGLAEMAAQIGMKKVPEESKPTVQKALKVLAKAKKDALQVVDLDPEVYEQVLKSYADAKKLSDDEAKNRLTDEALENSFRLQADLAFLVALAKESVQSFEGLIKGSIQNDLHISAKLLEAAWYGAYHTARINGVYLKNPQKKNRAEQALEELRKRFGIDNV